jgi:isoleucyl-tRNA synthetase
MAAAREAVRLGLAARAQAKVKLRQPLREAAVVAAGEERASIERLADVIAEELNVKSLRFVSGAEELGRYEIKPNYRALGPRFGSQMSQVAAAVAALDADHVASAFREGRMVGIALDGREHELTAEDLQLGLAPLEGYGVEREGGHAVALDLAIDDDLRREGLAREIVRAVQAARKAAGLAVEDRIALSLAGDDELLAAARAHEAFIAGETLARRVEYDGDAPSATPAVIEGRELSIGVARA